MPNDIANNMADTIHQLEKELKDLKEENKVLTRECDRLIKEKGELLSKVSGGDVLRICQLEEQLEKAKRLLKAAVEDLEKIAAIDECTYPYCDSRCPIECMGQCEEKHWKHTDEALKLIGGDDSESKD